MKSILSNCEREFISECITKPKRLDGRKLTEGRTLEIVFGQNRGCCMVMQESTRVLAQVTCEIIEPKPARPTEGTLHVNLELSQMAGPDVKQGRMNEDAIYAQSMLDRCIRDTKCLDLESLCIVAGSKVWNIRVDVHTLNDDGNMVECASIAAISALAHFRRPDVSVVGTDVTIHSEDDRDPVSLNLHHMPVNINLALFNQGEFIAVDPLKIEEKVADGCFIIGVNAHQEVCAQHYCGVLKLQVNTMLRCLDVAIRRVQDITQVIRKALDDDAYKRKTKEPVGFVTMLRTGTILGAKRFIPSLNLKKVEKDSKDEKDDVICVATTSAFTPKPRMTFEPAVSNAKEKALRILEKEKLTVFEGGASKWDVEEENDDDDSEDELPEKSPSVKEESDMSSEEEAAFMDTDQVEGNASGSRGWYSKNPFA